MRWFITAALLVPLLLIPLTLRAGPDEDLSRKLKLVEELMRLLEEAKAGAKPEVTFERRSNTVLKVYNIADLTVRLDSYVHPNLELKPAGAEIDESAPLFGKSEEGEMIFSGSEDIVDLLTQNVRPEVWDAGTHHIGVSGLHTLIVVADPAVHSEIAEYLAYLRRCAGKMITVEIRVLEAEEGAGAFPVGRRAFSLSREEGLGLLSRAEAGKGLSVKHSVRVTGYNGQRFGMQRGRQRSFIQDYDVEVAQNSKISDPIVGVVQPGLAFDVTPIARGEELIILDLRAQIATLAEPIREVETGSGPVQAPSLGLIDFATTVTVPDRAFALVGAGSGPGRGRWALLVSATAGRVVTRATGGGR